MLSRKKSVASFSACVLLIAGIYLIWNAWPKKEVLQGETIGELLEITGVLADIEPFLEKVGISKDTPLSVPPVQTTRLGIELVDGRNYQNFGLRFSKDGVLHRAVRMHPSYQNAPSRPEGLLTEVEFRSQIEAFMSLNVWGDPDDISYEITVEPGSDSGEENAATQFYGIAQRSYRGFLCASGVDFFVDRRTGIITNIANLPFKMPKSLEENITRDEALEIATAFAKKKNIYTDNSEVQQLITHTNEFWSVAEALLVSISPDTRLCWVINFKPRDADHATVLVACDNGSIAGGDWRRLPRPPEAPPEVGTALAE